MKRPSLRSILLLISVLFLLMPLGSIYFLRIYESTLIRQTESELISQAAFVSALYKHEIGQELKARHQQVKHYGIPVHKKPSHGNIYPIPVKLDLAKDKIFPPRPLAQFTEDKLDSLAQEAGQTLLPVLKDAQRITLSGIKVLDYQGIVVAGKDEYGLSFAHSEEFKQAKTGQAVHFLRSRRMPDTTAPLASSSRNSSINVFIALPIILEDRLIGVVWLNRTPPDVIQALYGKRREIIWTTLWLLIITALITAATSYAITRPIQQLVQKTRLVTQGDPKGLEAIENPVTSEVAQLSESLTEMAKTLHYRADYIQNFARHVSHEFKTPLTSIQGSVELLQDDLDTMPVAQQRRFLSNIRQDVGRLTLLVSRLMELAKADMTEPFTKSIRLLPALEETRQRYHSTSFNLELNVADDLKEVSVYAHTDTIQDILGHLLENSIQAGAKACQLLVSANGHTVHIQIRDDGPGISNKNQAQVFTPFFTTKRANGGTGLGLSISKSMVERMGGSLTLLEQDPGACFEITLPKAH